MLDSDLAELYEVKTKELNLAVKRNDERFPPEFMFRLASEEFLEANLRFQTETSSFHKHGGRRYLPHVFTEQGAAMLSSVLGIRQLIEPKTKPKRRIGIRGPNQED